MNIVVAGGTGMIGTKITAGLRERGHNLHVISPSRGTDFDDLEDLIDAVYGADVIVDATDVRTMSAAKAVRDFTTIATNLASAARSAKVPRIIAIGINGASDPAVNRFFGYYKGKAAQEAIYRQAALPTTMILTTQWCEAIPRFVRTATRGPVTVLPTMRIAPVPVDDVVELVVDYVELEDDLSHVVRYSGSDDLTLAEAARTWMAARGHIDGMRPKIITELPYLGPAIARGGLIPDGGMTRMLSFEEWLEKG